jgi:cellobiose-specific phosphotransferase system component IIC
MEGIILNIIKNRRKIKNKGEKEAQPSLQPKFSSIVFIGGGGGSFFQYVVQSLLEYSLSTSPLIELLVLPVG